MSKLGQGLQRLGDWFDRQKRVLPWRDDPSLYRVWISEIMLQQTQVVTVVPYFQRFLARFPTVQDLAAAPESAVVEAWAGLGYYSRARNLQRAAQAIVAAGAFPQTREGWLELPGVGPYTAGAIVSIALDRPEPILDGNVERVLSRLRLIRRSRGEAQAKARLWRLSTILVRRGVGFGVRPRVLNQALMELGATHCSPRKPVCSVCPLADLCRAHQTLPEQEDTFPERKKPKEWLKVDEVREAVFDRQGQVLVRQSQPGEWRAGLWDLPDPEERERRLKKGPLHWVAGPGGEVLSRHVVTRHKIERKTRIGVLPGRLAEGVGFTESSGWLWVDPRSPGVAVGSSFNKTLSMILERYPEVEKKSNS